MRSLSDMQVQDLDSWFESVATEQAPLIAITLGDRSISYHHLSRRSDRIA